MASSQFTNATDDAIAPGGAVPGSNGGAKRRPRVAIVVSHPIQHFVPFYRALAKEAAIELKVFYASKFAMKPSFDPGFNQVVQWDVDLTGGYENEFLQGADEIKTISFRSVNNPDLGKQLSRFSPDVVMIYGYSQMNSLKALAWCVRHRVPALMQSDSELVHQRRLSVRLAKEMVLRPLLGLVSGFLVIGDNNETYYRHYGVSDARFFRCPLSIDDELFLAAKQDRATHRRALRQEYEIPDDALVALFVGKLIARKRPEDVVAAIQKIQVEQGTGRPVYALFAGDGELRGSLEAAIAAREPSHCRLAGFVNQSRLPAFFAAADLLVHPSEHDPHPLTISEADFMGLPVVVSDRVGCVGPLDTARVGENAIVYPVGDAGALAAAFRRIEAEDGLLGRMSEASLRIAEETGVRTAVNAFLDAVQFVVKERSRA